MSKLSQDNSRYYFYDMESMCKENQWTWEMIKAVGGRVEQEPDGFGGRNEYFVLPDGQRVDIGAPIQPKEIKIEHVGYSE